MSSLDKRVTILLIKNGANVNARDHRGKVPLHEVQTPEITEFLVKAGADVNIQDRDGKTPLDSAKGSVKYYRERLAFSLKDEEEEKKNTPKKENKEEFKISSNDYKWSLGRYEKIAKILIKNGGDRKEKLAKKYKNKIPLVFKAIKEDNFSKLKALIENNPGIIDFRNKDLETPLYYAIKIRKKKIAHYLLEKGADPIQDDKDEYAPIHIAAIRGYTYLLKIMLDKGVYIDLPCR